jgi:hypothetical protein
MNNIINSYENINKKNNFNTIKYWEDRYKNINNSSNNNYNELSEFKFKIINEFIDKNNIKSMIENGISDLNKLKMINTLNKKYTGIDISKVIINKCKDIFENDNTKKFILESDINNLTADLVIACDFIYYLIDESEYIKYINLLFNMSTSFVVIYAKNENFNYKPYIKFRKFTDYINENFSNWVLIEHIPNIYPQLIRDKENDYTIPSDFYIYKKQILKKNLILTARFGTSSEFIKFTKKYMEKYATKCNADFLILTDKNYVKDWDFAKKFIIGRNNNYSYLFKILSINHYLKSYNKVLWLDDTCFVKNNCENLFDMITLDKYILAYPEGENNDLSSWKYDYNFILEKTGFELNTTKYINSGVVVYTKKILNILTNENILKYKDLLKSQFPHQCLLNYLLQINNIEILKLSENHNKMFLNCNYLNGRETKPNNLTSDIIISNVSKIFHITGFYKNRSGIIERIDNVLKELNIPIYISLTSIFSKQKLLLKTLRSILNQTKLPDKIFIHLSEKSYLLDHGFTNKIITCSELADFLKIHEKIIRIFWVENDGPYRKLLPTLRRKWNEDCIIITIDDDTVYDKNLIQKMVSDYIQHRCVINYRGFLPLCQNLSDFDYNKRKISISKIPPNGYKDLYNFPTGVAGILYKPSFFHKTNNLIFNKDIYMKECSMCDDIWFYLLRIKNNIKCFLRFENFSTEDLSNTGLFLTFNKYDNNNSIVLRKTFSIIDKL